MEDLQHYVQSDQCYDNGTPVALVSGFIPPNKFYLCLNQLKAVNTQVDAALTFNAENTILTSFVEFKYKLPQAQDMVAVMDQT